MGHMIEKKEKATKVFIEDFGKHKIFAVYEVDEEGEKIPDKKAVVQFGKTKALAILTHGEELRNLGRA